MSNKLRILHSIRSVNPAGGGPIEGLKQLSAINLAQLAPIPSEAPVIRITFPFNLPEKCTLVDPEKRITL